MGVFVKPTQQMASYSHVDSFSRLIDEAQDIGFNKYIALLRRGVKHTYEQDSETQINPLDYHLHIDMVFSRNGIRDIVITIPMPKRAETSLLIHRWTRHVWMCLQEYEPTPAIATFLIKTGIFMADIIIIGLVLDAVAITSHGNKIDAKQISGDFILLWGYAHTHFPSNIIERVLLQEKNARDEISEAFLNVFLEG